jgi:hypothetical protein
MRACFDQYPEDMMLNKFEMKKVGSSQNYQNSYWNVIRYEYFSRVKLPDPQITQKDPD